MSIYPDNKECLLINKKVRLTNIDGLGSFHEDIIGVVVNQEDCNNCKILLDKELEHQGNIARELDISARHKGYSLNKIVAQGIRKVLDRSPIIAVNAIGSEGGIGFIAEICYEGKN